ncbi:conserved hypothetical protein [Leishmania major strain Friedlin]|uniref:Uncharacterized protein n=1 Tax=Leishmania major TaxID=5664 RepID=Q4QD17_LEIMA|nr:conserved hypothetical protein [Leishmania major strain Friedlin]CAG9573098.1 hypothetical_protein_-_conserved [Leishmania major strain Friedlin]CAJ03602.1 conserved hypothetical protein [Leishmania major strain Friedlin]|eukprot:XP_001682781.1 conserved hypothetical protein [Leishmania major strain Friedlin]
MHRASQTLWMAPASRAVAEDGQESMKRLALAPLTFLSLSGSTSSLASILASAVGFLEGYSASDWDTNINLAKNSSGELVAHTKLTFVPYTFRRAPTLVSSTSVLEPSPLSSEKALRVSRSLSISHVVADAAPRALSPMDVSQLQRFKDSFKGSATAADYVANDLLRTTGSVEVAKAVLQLAAQVGLTIPRSTLKDLVHRMKHKEASFASSVYQEFAFEVNLEALHESSLISSRCVQHRLALPPRKRKESKLERVRRSTSPKW